MRLRPVLFSALAVGLMAGGSALAGPKASCNLVADPAGDGTHRSTGLKSSPLDVLGADLATGKKEVVGVITLATTTTSSEPYSLAMTYSWSLAFNIQGQDYTWTLDRYAQAYGSRETASASMADSPADVTYTVTPNSIIFTTPRKFFGSTLVRTPGKMYLDSISAASYLEGGNADSAIGGAVKYLDLYPSCLKPA